MKKQIILTIIALLGVCSVAVAQSSTTYYQHTKQTKQAVQTADIAAIARYESQIRFLYENPTDNQIQKWCNEYRNVFQALGQEYKKTSKAEGLDIPNFMIKNDPGLVYLIYNSKSIETNNDKQSWFYLYATMNEEKKMKLYKILYSERYKLNKIEEKYKNKR